MSIETPFHWENAIQFLLGRINYETFQQIPYAEMRQNLDQLRAFLDFLGAPDRHYPIIHVAGTKGKGSTCYMIDAILSEAGLKVGRFTSPHLHSLCERFTIGGIPCPESELATVVASLAQTWDEWQPAGNILTGNISNAKSESSVKRELTFFEWSTVIAFEYFARASVDVAVMEVGLGGTYDATNVCQPVLSVITSISFEHTEQLGNTLAAIAGEKAGIIKPYTPVISGVTFADHGNINNKTDDRIGAHVDNDPAAVIRNIAWQHNAPFFERNQDFFVRDHVIDPQNATTGQFDIEINTDTNNVVPIPNLSLQLLGHHQRDNAAVAVMAVMLLPQVVRSLTSRRDGHFDISPMVIRNALAKLTIPARAEQWFINNGDTNDTSAKTLQPTIIIDGAHNRKSAQALCEVIETLDQMRHFEKKYLLFGSTIGKDVAGMLETLIPLFNEVVLSQYSKSSRFFPVRQLQKITDNYNNNQFETILTIEDALHHLHARITPNDLLCVTGSLYFAAEIRQYFLTDPW